MRRPTSRSQSGTTLLEAMIALTILLVGLTGFMHFQVYGVTSTNGGRMHGVAVELAREVVTGLERLPYNHPALANTGSSGPTPPEPFGWLARESDLTVAHAWADGLIPGVRSSAELTQFGPFERRWTVWGYAPTPGGAPAVKVIAVSVIYVEPRSTLRREVVQYTQLADPAAYALNITANQ